MKKELSEKTPKKSRRELLAAGVLGLAAGEAAAQTAEKWTPKKQAVGRRPGQVSKDALISSCIRSGHLLFVSGISGWYPDRRKEPGDIKVQIESALTSMKELLER